jgi:hypothetical protein
MYVCRKFLSSTKLSEQKIIFASSLIFCPRGEIGRLAILRGWCWQRRAGSNPVVGTFNNRFKPFRKKRLYLNWILTLKSNDPVKISNMLISTTS